MAAAHLPRELFVNPHTKTYVDIIGMAHFAHPLFYERVDDLTSANEAHHGAVTLAEGLRETPAAELRRALPEDLRKMQLLQTMGGLLAPMLLEICDTYPLDHPRSLVPQELALPAAPHWINADVTRLELVQHMDRKALRNQVIAAAGLSAAMRCLPAERRQETIRSVLFKVIQGLTADRSQPTSALGNFLNNDPAILDMRNRNLLGAIDRQDRRDPRNITVPWGAAHLPGIARGLVRRGYRHANSQRLPAMAQ